MPPAAASPLRKAPTAMRPTRTPLRELLATAPLWLAAAASAQTCEAIRDGIDAKIRAAGVASFTLQVVDSAASAPGQVVGRCDRGAKKIVYAKTVAAAAEGARPAPRPPARGKNEPILTECKDGTVTMGGDCRGK